MRFRNRIKIGLMVLVALAIPTLIMSQIGRAVDGEEQLCLDYTPADAIGNAPDGLGNVNLHAQGFTPTSSFSIGAVKGGWFGLGQTDTATIYITETSIGGVPDMNNILGSEVLDLQALPLFDFTMPISNPFTCDGDLVTSQVVIFDPAVPVASGTEYAIVTEFNTGTPTSVYIAWPYDIPEPAVDPYSGGEAYFCNQATTCTPTTPATWTAPPSCPALRCNYNLSIFDNIINPVDNDVDSWIINFLESLGLNSPFGKVLAGAIFTAVIFMILAINGVPWIIALGLAGMAVTVLTAALIFNPAILLGLAAIVMMGGMLLIFTLVLGADRDG